MDESRTPPMFYIVLAQLCQFMVQRGVANCLMFLHDAFPLPDDDDGANADGDGHGDEDASGSSSSSSSGVNRADADKRAILADMKETAQMLLRKYVERHGSAAADELLAGFDPRARAEPSGVRVPVLAFIARARTIQAELAKLFARDATSSASAASSSSSSQANAVSPSSSLAASGEAVLARVKSRVGAERAMARLFAARVQIFGPVAPQRAAPLAAVHRIAFKAALEGVRALGELNPAALRQLQVDVCALRAGLPAAASLSAGDREALGSLLDDVLASGVDRCAQDVSALEPALHARVKVVRDTVVFE